MGQMKSALHIWERFSREERLGLQAACRLLYRNDISMQKLSKSEKIKKRDNR